jgi:hypothetical protein
MRIDVSARESNQAEALMMELLHDPTLTAARDGDAWILAARTTDFQAFSLRCPHIMPENGHDRAWSAKAKAVEWYD